MEFKFRAIATVTRKCYLKREQVARIEGHKIRGEAGNLNSIKISSSQVYKTNTYLSSVLGRVAQTFKHEIFTWDRAFSWSLRKRNAEKCKFYQNRTTFRGCP